MNRRAWLVCAVVTALATSATAARADEAEGKRHWKAGQELYAQKRFIEAAHEFELGYAQAPRPLFLMNIGHAYRRANELVKAKTAYETLLRLQPDLPQRTEVENYIKSIDDALQAGEGSVPDQTRPVPRPTPPPPTPAPPVLVKPTPAPVLPLPLPPPPPAEAEPAPPPVYVEAREPARREPESTSVFRKPWFWVVTGAVIAGGVAAAVIVSRPSSSCPGTICIRE